MTDNTEQNYTATADELRQFIERFERLEAERKDIAEQQKEVMAEAKSRGYCVRTLRRVIYLRKKSKSERDESDAIEKIYKDALGM